MQVNSNAQEQTNVFDGLRTAVGGIGKALAATDKAVSATKAQMAAPPSENAFKTFFSNILGYYKKGQKSVSDSAKKSQDGINTSTLSTTQTTNDKVVANAKTAQDKIRTSAIDSAQKTADSVFTIVTKSIEEQSNAKVAGLETDRKAIEANASLSAADKKQKENQIYNEEYQIKLKAFKEEQKANIAQAIMNGAIAVTKSEAELGPIAGTLALGAIVAQTAAQVATIKAQQPPTLQTAAKGGYFKSDGKAQYSPGTARLTMSTPIYVQAKLLWYPKPCAIHGRVIWLAL